MDRFETTLTTERIRRWTAAGYWRDHTLDDYLDRWATTRPDHPAIVDGQSRYTWRALVDAVDRVAYGLQAAGVEPGTAVSCQLPN